MKTVGFPFVDKILLSEMSHRIDNAINLKKIQFYETLLRRVCSMYKISCDNTSDVLSSHDSLSITEMKEEKRKIEHRIASPRPSQQIINKLLNWNNINFEDDTATAFTDDEDENGSSSTIVRSLPLSVLPLRTSAIDNSKKMMMVNDDDSRDKEKEVDGSYAILSTAGISVNINNGISGNKSSSLNTEISLSSMAPSQSRTSLKKKRKRCSKNNNGSGGSSGGDSGYGGSGELLPSSALSTTSSATSTFTTTTINEDEIHSTKLQKVNDVTASLKKNDYAPSTNFQNKARLKIKEVRDFETHINVATNYDITKNVPIVYDQMNAFSTPESASVSLVQPDLSTTANGTENCDVVNVQFTFGFPQPCKDVNEAASASTDVNVSSIETPTSEMLPPPSPLSPLPGVVWTDKELAFLHDLDNMSMFKSQQSIDIPASREMPSDAISVATAELPAAVVNDVNNMNLTKEPTSKSVDNFNVRWYVKHCLSQIKISPKDRWASLENSFQLGLLTFCKGENPYIIPDGSTKKYYLFKNTCKELQNLNSGPFSILVAARCNRKVGKSIVIVYHNLRQIVYDEFIAIMNGNYTISHMKQIDDPKDLSELQEVDKKCGIIVHSASLNSFLGFRPLYFREFGVWGIDSNKRKLCLKICCRDISDQLINCDKSDKLIDCGLAQIPTGSNISKQLIDSSIKYVEATDNKVMGTVRVGFHDFDKDGVCEGKVVTNEKDMKMSTFLINRNLDGMCCIDEILFDRTDIITYLP